MAASLEIEQVTAVQTLEDRLFEVRLMLIDGSELILKMDGPTLCRLADLVSQYATP